MDTDREFEHMMMSVRNSSGSITQMVYAANMLQIKLVQLWQGWHIKAIFQ